MLDQQKRLREPGLAERGAIGAAEVLFDKIGKVRRRIAHVCGSLLQGGTIGAVLLQIMKETGQLLLGPALWGVGRQQEFLAQQMKNGTYLALYQKAVLFVVLETAEA